MNASKSMKLSGLALCLLVLAGLLSACGIGRHQLLGKWELADPADPTKLSGTVLDFGENGTLSIMDPKGTTQEINYQFRNETLLRLQNGAFIAIQIAGDTLNMTFLAVDPSTGQLTQQGASTATRTH